MEIPSGLKKALEAVGVNVTRLEWRLRERESRRERERLRGDEDAPARKGFQHKICGRCGRIVDRESKVCEHCGAAVASAGVWRAQRALSLALPADALVVTGAFVVLILANFVVGVASAGGGSIMSPRMETLAALGAYVPRHSMYDQWWRLFSFSLVHGGLIHLLFNTMALTQIGPALERELGWKRLLVVITLAQFVAALAAMYKAYPVVGASGWIFGLIGFGFVYNKRLGRRDLASFFLNWVIYAFVFGLILGAHNWAHAGGAVGGGLAGLIFPLRLGREDALARFWNSMVVPCVALWGFTVVKIVMSIKMYLF